MSERAAPAAPDRKWRHSRDRSDRPRLLVERDDAALAISDFRVFEEAGFDVALCRGPREVQCPVIEGRACDLLAGADVVLHGLDPALGVAGALIGSPGRPPVIVQRRRQAGASDDGRVPAGFIALDYPCSVAAQVDAVRRSLAWPRGSTADRRGRQGCQPSAFSRAAR